MSADDHIKTGRNVVEVKKIQTVYHYRNGPSLQEVLLREDVKDLPILVFSIAGKTRGGKSFLLNLMIQYLEHLENKNTGDWRCGRVPNCFPWRNGIESVTRGLWICPKIFRLKDCCDNEVGVMLLDMEGMYDGEATDGEIIAISGISAAISYLQMFNMKEKITGDYLESVVRNLIKGIEELHSEGKEELKDDYKLMFVIRDWIGEDSYGFGLVGGKDYIEKEGKRIFTDHGNFTKVEKWKSSFEETLADVKFSGLNEAKSELFNILCKAERTLIGKSRTMYLDELTKTLEGAFNQKVIDIIFQQYESSFLDYSSIEKQQSGIWPDVKRKLHKHLCGNNTTRQKAYLIFIKKSAAHYYCLLHKEHKRLFQAKCSMKMTLKKCAGLDEEEIKSFKECEDFTSDMENKEIVFPLWLKEYQCLKNEITNILLQRIENITGIGLDILKKLRRKQYEHFELFTLLNKDEFNLDSIPQGNKLVIAKKVGYGMFGPPRNLSIALPQKTQPCSPLSASVNVSSAASLATSAITTYFRGSGTDENVSTGYSKDQETMIWPVVKKIISLSTSGMVEFSCVFIVYDQDNAIVNVPLFRVKTRSGIIYIDSNCRQYTEWNNFLISNTLPDVVYCYPLNGRYIKTEGFVVAFSTAPASETITKVLKTGDQVGKGVTAVAGIAGCAVLFGVAAPVVASIAIGGGVVGGVYGTIRGIQKIRDKKEHGEPLKGKDVWNVAANSLAVVGAIGMAVGRTVAVAAEGAAFILGTRAAAGLSGINSLTAVFTDTKDTSELISLIAEVEDSSLKILFYFGTTCSNNALNVIRESLRLEDNKNTVETLLALLENNCIQFAAETGTGGIRFEKYVSQNTATLVRSILTAISSDVRDIVLHYCEIHSVFQSFGITRKEFMIEKLQRIMREIFVKLEDEFHLSKTRFVNVLCHNIDTLSNDSTLFQSLFDKLDSEEGHYLVVAFRHLIWSLISEIRKANNFFNNIDHKAVTLKDHYLSDVLCHPLHEISQLVKEIVEQTESAIDFKSTNIDTLNDFVLGVLMLLEQNGNEFWSVYQFARCLINITKDVVSGFESVVSEHKKLVNDQKNVSCDDLDILTEQIGLEGYNYGTWVSKKVLSELKVDVDAIENMTVDRQRAQKLTIVPAFSGILDHLYYYYSKPPVSKKLDLIRQFENVPEENYIEHKQQDYNLSIFAPCDEDVHLTSFVVYSESKEGNGEGFIWLYKKDEQSAT